MDQRETSSWTEHAVSDCVAIIRSFYTRGWVLGTGGNFSVMLSREPFRLAITASGIDKSSLMPEDFLHIDACGTVLEGKGKPTAEAGLHRAVLDSVDAGAVFHTHSVWATVLSTTDALTGGIDFEGYEMLKGLQGIDSHAHREWLPIIENSQDIPALGDVVRRLLVQQPHVHGFLIRGHGLYTWGKTIEETKRHVEIFEFLLEVAGRYRAMVGEPSERVQ